MADRLVEALMEVATMGEENLDHLQQRVRWVSFADGEVFFNNEYRIARNDLVPFALLLLGYARRLKEV
jgi:hypothetical protein